jgi:hypothetical protein
MFPLRFNGLECAGLTRRDQGDLFGRSATQARIRFAGTAIQPRTRRGFSLSKRGRSGRVTGAQALTLALM